MLASVAGLILNSHASVVSSARALESHWSGSGSWDFVLSSSFDRSVRSVVSSLSIVTSGSLVESPTTTFMSGLFCNGGFVGSWSSSPGLVVGGVLSLSVTACLAASSASLS